MSGWASQLLSKQFAVKWNNEEGVIYTFLPNDEFIEDHVLLPVLEN